MVVISSEEQDAIHSMESKLKTLKQTEKECEEKQKMLEQQQKEQEQKIDAVFESLRNALNQRQNDLKMKLSQMVDAQRSTLQSLSDGVQKHCQSITEGLQLQKDMVTGSSKIDEKQRKIKIKNIAETTLKTINDTALVPKIHPIEFRVDLTAELIKFAKVWCFGINESACPLVHELGLITVTPIALPMMR